MSLPIKPRINCKDGVSLSVQADEHKYCLPRHDEGPHHAVEVGYICDAEGESMSPPESWAPYADGMFPSDVLVMCQLNSSKSLLKVMVVENEPEQREHETPE